MALPMIEKTAVAGPSSPGGCSAFIDERYLAGKRDTANP